MPSSKEQIEHCATSISSSTMNFHFENIEHQVVIAHMGESLNFNNADDFKFACLEHLRAGIHHFILDFSQTGILDSTGLGAVYFLYQQVSPRGGQVVFASASHPVRIVVQLTRTHRVFPQYATVQAAQHALEQATSV